MKKKFTEELSRKRKNHQFSDDSINFLQGCGQDDSYSYASEMAKKLHHKSPLNWKKEAKRNDDNIN